MVDYDAELARRMAREFGPQGQVDHALARAVLVLAVLVGLLLLIAG
jgi:hypothetical protein